MTADRELDLVDYPLLLSPETTPSFYTEAPGGTDRPGIQLP